MRLREILCFGLLFVLARQATFAQCGQTTQQVAVLTAPKTLPSAPKRDSADPRIFLRLEMTDKGLVQAVEVLGDYPVKSRAAAISEAIKFAKTNKYLDRTTWPWITIYVWFPQKGDRAPLVEQMSVGVMGCVPAPKRIRVSSWVMGCLLVDRVEPIYPAGTQNVKDRLTLAALVGKDGTVIDARKISGPENLLPAAIDAVKKWKYRPYLLNGEAFEVDTTVDLPAAAPSCMGVIWPFSTNWSTNAPPPSWLFNTQPVMPVLAVAESTSK